MFVVVCLMKSMMFLFVVRNILQSCSECVWLSMARCSWWFDDGDWRHSELLLTQSSVDVPPQSNYTRSLLCYASNLILGYSAVSM